MANPKGRDATLRLAHKRLPRALKADKDQRDLVVEDLEFAAGENHWTKDAKTARAGRVCLTINLIPEKLDIVDGDYRMNPPQMKVVPVDGAADPEIAKIINGMVKNIENNSDASQPYQHAFTHMAAAGRGCWRMLVVDTDEYDSDLVPLKELIITRVDNVLQVVFDDTAKQPDRQDGKFLFIFEDLHRDEFKDQFPGKQPVEFSASDEDHKKDWCTQDTVRIAEYFYKKKVKKKIYKYADGRITFDERPGEEVVLSKDVEVEEIYWCKIDGQQYLEPARPMPDKYFSVFPVWGKELNVAGKRNIRGLVRNAKDPQRAYEYSRSAEIEITALAPKSPYMLTPKQLGNHKPQWDRAHLDLFPYLLFDSDPDFPYHPKREQPPGIPSGEAYLSSVASDEIKSTTGISDARRGVRSNETSGRAIRERKDASGVGSFAYIDNMARGHIACGKAIIDMIPKVYDTDRIVRITLPDGTERSQRINGPVVQDDGSEKIFDLGIGKYDAVVTVGPSYSTQRQEAADAMGKLINSVPDVFKVIGDLFVSGQDWPNADLIAARVRKMIPPEVLDDAQNAGASPEQVTQAIQQAIDEFVQSAEGQKLQIELEQEKVKLAQDEVELEKAKADLAATVDENTGNMQQIEATVLTVLERFFAEQSAG